MSTMTYLYIPSTLIINLVLYGVFRNCQAFSNPTPADTGPRLDCKREDGVCLFRPFSTVSHLKCGVDKLGVKMPEFLTRVPRFNTSSWLFTSVSC